MTLERVDRRVAVEGPEGDDEEATWAATEPAAALEVLLLLRLVVLVPPPLVVVLGCCRGAGADVPPDMLSKRLRFTIEEGGPR